MTSLADLTPGQQFLFTGQVVTADPVAGFTLILYGPGAVQAATAAITPAGAMTGQLSGAPSATPVTVVTGFAPVTPGDVLQNQETGEALVARWAQVTPDGASQWSPTVTHQVIYKATGWAVIGHVSLQ